ncbi:MAG: DUF2336 domain-containing protein, partial [Salinarimonas sp.]
RPADEPGIADRHRGRAEALSATLPPLLVEADRVAATVAQGVHGRRRVGTGESFWQFRGYQPGDPVGRIDWRQSAKTQSVYIRELEWEAAQSVWLWADRSPSMNWRSAADLPTKADRAAILLLALSVLLSRAGERVAVLCLERGPSLSEEHVALFDDVLEKLVGDITFRVRVALSERFADCPNAPRKVVFAFGSDDEIRVAGPVLERSARLDLDALLAIARTKGQDHLCAIAKRPHVAEPVTDILLERGGRRVVATAAGNPGVAFSADGTAILVARAQTDDALVRALAARDDTFAGRITALVAKARARVRDTLAVETGADPELIEALVARVGDEIAEKGDKRTLLGQFAEPMAAMQDRAAQTGLAEIDALGALLDGRPAEALCVIAILQGVPVEFVARAFHASTYAPILVIARACDFRWKTVHHLLHAKLGRALPEVLVEDARATFERLGPATARRVLRAALTKERGLRH